jgi:hypothetical protein
MMGDTEIRIKCLELTNCNIAMAFDLYLFIIADMDVELKERAEKDKAERKEYDELNRWRMEKAVEKAKSAPIEELPAS